VVSIPLVAQEKVLGAINVTSREIVPPSEESLAVPAAIGQQIGVAIDNARLYAQSVEYARQMELARQAADAANASKSVFLANVSHELRTPLVSILGFARIVQKRLDERLFPIITKQDDKTHKAMAQVDDNLEIILTEGQRLTTLINNLLDLEKIEAGKMEWHFQPVSIGDTIRHAAAATAALFEGKSLSLVLDIPSGLPMVKGDPDKLLQVVINLISNAVKFSPQGMVLIGAIRLDGEVIVRVADQGIGIAPQDQEYLFEKFTQVGDALTGKPRGTGLGLAISKEIVEHHAGRIWVESQP
jgi:signal transduction histidine kinase